MSVSCDKPDNQGFSRDLRPLMPHLSGQRLGFRSRSPAAYRADMPFALFTWHDRPPTMSFVRKHESDRADVAQVDGSPGGPKMKENCMSNIEKSGMLRSAATNRQKPPASRPPPANGARLLSEIGHARTRRTAHRAGFGLAPIGRSGQSAQLLPTHHAGIARQQLR